VNRLLLVSLALLVPAALGSAARADGCPPSTCGVTSLAAPGSPLLVVRPAGQQGPLDAYNVANGRRRFSLPAGMLAANGRTFVSALPIKGGTRVIRFDASTGALRSAWPVRSSWTLAGVSSTGRWAGLVRIEDRGRTTRFAVVDVLHRRIIDRVRLRGTFELETLSADGQRLFLVHYRSSDYVLQLYDLNRQLLRANPIRSKDPDETKMTGTAARAVATRDGHWLLTLYLKSDGTAFIHALDLRAGAPHCIDLPGSSQDFGRLGAYALVLSPDGGTLYVANPLLGRVAAIDLRRLEVARTISFAARRTRGFDRGLGPVGAISRNGRTLYFSGPNSVWAYDTAYARVRGPYRHPGQIAGLGFSPAGHRVLVLRGDGTRMFLDAATGRTLRT
jgi:hypothetical protein